MRGRGEGGEGGGSAKTSNSGNLLILAVNLYLSLGRVDGVECQKCFEDV